MSTAPQPSPETGVQSPKNSPADAVRLGSKAEVAIVTVTVLVLIALSGIYIPKASYSYFVVLGAFAIFCLFLGRWVNGRPLGIFVGDRNLMSLSRFQMVLWTVLILSAYLTMCLYRLRNGTPDPLAVAMDWHLWALMGISTASMVGSPLLLGNKTQSEAPPDAVKKAAAQLSEDASDIKQNSAGKLYGNKSVNDASLTDIFQGDEIGNTAYIDVAKVQMFFFTFVSLWVYGAATLKIFNGDSYSAMPAFSDGLVALLGVSHAGYLTSKIVDHTHAN